MKAELQHKEPQKAEPIQSKRERSKLSFIDNRPQTASQTKLIQSIQKKENKTGLPDNLKTGVEDLSGFSMDDVRVHYNSSKPAQLDALSYAQRTNIHVVPGQEKHRESPIIQRIPWDSNGIIKKAFKEHPFPGKNINQIKSNEYKNTNLIKATNKLDFMIQAANFIAGLGVPILQYLAKRPTQSDNEIDPFTILVQGAYPVTENPNFQMSLQYRFAKNGYGYIISIDENGTSHSMNEKRGQDAVLGANEYASAHYTYTDQLGAPRAGEPTGHAAYDTTALSTLINLNSGDKHIGLDSMTKIAAEGARFQLVRTHANTLTNNTKIYTLHNGGSIGVPFRILWGKWKDWFGSQFNIDDNTVATALRQQCVGLNVIPGAGDIKV